MDPVPHFQYSLPASMVTPAVDTIPRTTITSTTACISLSHGPVRHHLAEMAEYSFALGQKFDALSLRDQIVTLDVWEVSTIGTLEVIRDRFVRFELIKKYGSGAAEWKDEVDKSKVPFTRAACHITPRSDGSFRMVHRNRSLQIGQTIAPYQDSILASKVRADNSQGSIDEETHFLDLLAFYEQSLSQGASSSPLNSPVPSHALPPPLIPLPSSPSQPSLPAIPPSVPSTPSSSPDPVPEPSSLTHPLTTYSDDAPPFPQVPEFNTAEYPLAENSSRNPPQSPPRRTTTSLTEFPVPTQLPTLTPDPPRTPYTQSETQWREVSGTKQLPPSMSIRKTTVEDETSADPSGREIKIDYSSKRGDSCFVGITYDDVYKLLDRIEDGSVKISPSRESQDIPVVPIPPQIPPFRDKMSEMVPLDVPPPSPWKYPFSTTDFPSLSRILFPLFSPVGYPVPYTKIGVCPVMSGERCRQRENAMVSGLMTLLFLFAFGQ